MEQLNKKKLFLAVLIGLVAVVLLVVAVVLSLESGVGSSGADGTISFFIPENELLVKDLYSGDILIPKFDVPENRYDREKFTEKDGFLRYDDRKAVLGVDVSEHQEEVDWKAVKEAGIDFAILRLGYRGSTQGLLNVDERFERNFRDASEAGLSVGVYFFSQAVSDEEARDEADFVLDTLNGRELTWPVVFDWEPPAPESEGNYRTENATGEEVSRYASLFCEKVRQGGYVPCVYTNKYMAYHFFDLEKLKDCDLWYAEYQKVPSFYYDFRLWQYTSEGTVPGIAGPVDIDICFNTY